MAYHRNFLLILIIPLFVLAYSCSNNSNSQDNTKKIIISSDVGAGLVNGTSSSPSDTDDSYAIELMTSYVDAEVLAVVTVHGNNIEPATFFAANQTFLDTPGVWNGPISRGSQIPLALPDDIIWTGGINGDESEPQLCINVGVQAMADLLEESEDLVTILALGPLTDIACLVLNFPDVLDKIEEIVFLGGRAPDQLLAYDFAPDVIFTDFNVAQDNRAAQVVLEQSTIPFTFINFSISSSSLYTDEQIDSLGDPECGARSQLLSRASQDRLEELAELLGMDVMDTFDINAAYYLAKPEMFICEDAGFDFVDCAIGTTGVYNGVDNPCAGHGPDQPSDLNLESVQLWVDPSYLGQSRTVNSCISYVNQEELERFETGTIEVFCEGDVWADLPE
ncbi:MAG: nucleoside hydrolase [Thermodesulfobacteriota bacterium]